MRDGRPGCSQGSPPGTETTAFSCPCPAASRVSVAARGCARVTGKAGENGQYSATGRQLTLDKTVGTRVRWHTQGLDELRLDLGWGPGEPGSGVAIDWVTSRSYSSAVKTVKRLNVHSDLRKGRAVSRFERSRECWKGTCEKQVGPCKGARQLPTNAHGWKGGRRWVRLERMGEPERSPKITSAFPLPLRYIDVTRATSTTFDVMLERRIDDVGISKGTEIYQTRGQVSHDSQYWMKNLQTDISGPGSGWRRSKQHPGAITWVQRYGETCQMQRNDKKNKNGLLKNRSSTVQEVWEVFISSIPQMRSSRKLFKMRGESWKFRCQQLCLARSGEESTRDLKHSWYSQDKICMHCWSRWFYEKTFRRYSASRSWRPHIAGKGINSLNHYNIGVQIYSYASHNENHESKSSSESKMGKAWENTGMAGDESQKQNRGDRWSKERTQNSAFCFVDGSLSSQKGGVGTEVSKV